MDTRLRFRVGDIVRIGRNVDLGTQVGNSRYPIGVNGKILMIRNAIYPYEVKFDETSGSALLKEDELKLVRRAS